MTQRGKAPRGGGVCTATLCLRTLAALLAGTLLLAAPGCSNDDGEGAAGSDSSGTSGAAVDPVKGPWNLLLITTDTTRSDRLGCYGYHLPTTPEIDRLAERGIVFEQAISPTPITLPSHATLLTGLDPHEHGVRNNNTFILDDDFTTLAERLKEKGYATGATLGAFPVDKRFGLAQGFDLYDDAFSAGGSMPGVRMTQRDATDVTNRALQWMKRYRAQKFFHWAHYFDPHFPWEAPRAFREKFLDSYNAEIAYMDSEIGRFVRELDAQGLTDRTWIVLVGDHGESLEEHGELTHAFLIYGATQRVPCIVIPPRAWKGLPDDKVRGRRIADLVRVKDLFPTMLDALGLDPDAGASDDPASANADSALSLLALAGGTAEVPGFAYMETLAPAFEFDWCELRGVRTAEWSYIRAPVPELYDLTSDPGERKNVYDDHPEVAARLSSLCDQLIRNEIAVNLHATDQEAMDKLRALGYTAAPTAVAAPRGPDENDKDPKALIHLERMISIAMKLKSEYKPADSRKVLEDVLAEDPENPFASRMLLSLLVELGEFETALEKQGAHLANYPDDWEILCQKAQVLALRQEFDEAIAILEDVLERNPGYAEADDLYPRILVGAGKTDETRSYLTDAINAAPNNADAYARLAKFEMFSNNISEALKHANKAITTEEGHPGGHTVLGEILFNQGMREKTQGKTEYGNSLLAQARTHMEKALASDPLESMAAYRIGFLLHMENKLEQARNYYQAALTRRPNWPEVHARLGDVMWKLKKVAQAIQHFKQAYTFGFRNTGFLINFGNVMAESGQSEAAMALWQEALDTNPSPQLQQKIRANMERLKELQK